MLAVNDSKSYYLLADLQFNSPIRYQYLCPNLELYSTPSQQEISISVILKHSTPISSIMYPQKYFISVIMKLKTTLDNKVKFCIKYLIRHSTISKHYLEHRYSVLKCVTLNIWIKKTHNLLKAQNFSSFQKPCQSQFLHM